MYLYTFLEFLFLFGVRHFHIVESITDVTTPRQGELGNNDAGCSLLSLNAMRFQLCKYILFFS